MDLIASHAALRRRTSPESLAWLLLLCVLGLTGGCHVTNKAVPIDISDNGASAFDARSIWRFGPRQDHGVEVDYAQHRGSSTSLLGTGSRVMLGSAVIDGPETLHNEATVRSLHVAYNYLIAPSNPVEAEAFAGVGRMEFKLLAQGSAPGARISRTLGGGIGVIGIGPRWKLREQLALEGRLTLMGRASNGPDYEKQSIDLALAYRPVKQMTLRAGYSWLKATVEHETDDSDVSIKLRGPFLGVTLNF